MKRISFLLHALSPLHCGTGQGVDVIDLPIARMHATGIPYVPGTSLKGVLRSVAEATLDQSELFAVFGPDTNGAADNAGAFVVGDARLLLLPVRSFKGAFAWVTSPLLLHLAARDLVADHDSLPEVPQLNQATAIVSSINHVNVYNQCIYLQDIRLTATHQGQASQSLQKWCDVIASLMPEAERKLLSSRLVLVDDETMTFLWETATQVDARNRLNQQGTVEVGALWYEESLPPETILIGQLAAEQSRRKGVVLSPDLVLKKALPSQSNKVIQVGGKATVGRGICSLYMSADQVAQSQEAVHA
jgi:CRISPR-associated protein Cmr4